MEDDDGDDDLFNSNLPVKEDLSEALVKVHPKPRDHLLQDVGLGASGRTPRKFVRLVLAQDRVDREGNWERHQLLVLRDVFPIVNEDRLDAIGDRQLDRWPSEESGLLEVRTR